jgi:Predicted NADH:ubiquinone oxidoreductase, subunit RnfA
MNLFALFISAMLINNIVLTKFLGMCPFMGVTTKLDSAIGMGAAVIFVIFGASVLSWMLYYWVLVPLNLEYMELITFILLIAAFVQFVELFLKKNSPVLYKQLGIYLPLITTNCTVLYVAQQNITEGYTLVQTMVNSVATPAGFMTSRWGSCTPARSHISMSVRLIHYPKECLDYVLLHEIAKGLRIGVRNGDIHPVYCGSAINQTGIERLLDLITEFFPSYAEKGHDQPYPLCTF